MASLLEAQSGPFRLESPWRVAVFFTLFPILLIACVLFLLASGILLFPGCLAWFIYVAAEEELDFFSFPIILESVVEDIACFTGLKQESAFIFIERGDYNREDDNYFQVSLRMKFIHPRRESFISDFNEPEEEPLNNGNPKKQYFPESPGIQSKITTTITNALRFTSNSALSTGTDSCFEFSSISQSPSTDYHSATSVVSTEESIRTPDQKLFNFSWRTISPHWSAGRPITKSGTPSPLELSPGELEYPDSCMPSPKRWPSPASDEEYFPYKEKSLSIRLQKAALSEYIKASERMFFADNVGNTHLYETESTHSNIKSNQSVDNLSRDYSLLITPPKLERKLFAAEFEENKLANPGITPLVDKKTHGISLAEYNSETTLTIGWSRRYKDLITELKGSLGKQESEDEDESKTENFDPVTDIDLHWMDIPRLEPLERPHLNKLQRWSLARTHSKSNLKDGIKEQDRQNTVSRPSNFPSLEVSPFTLKEDYNFGNLKISPGGRDFQGYGDGESYKSYWEGFDEAYIIPEPKSSEDRGDEEERWKIPMGKWEEKGVEIMKPVDEESRDIFDRSSLLSPSPRKIVHWPSPLSDSSEREPLLLHHDSHIIDSENINGSYRITNIEVCTSRTPSPVLLLEGKESKKETIPLEETSNRLFGRRLAKVPRFPITPPNTLTTPPRPLPEKLIRMFEDLSKPQPTSPRPSSINSSPERFEGFHGKDVRGLGIDFGDDTQISSSHEIRRKPTSGSKGNDDELNECF